MKELLPEKALNEMIKALMQGEDYSYQDENTNIHITPNRIQIQYKSTPKQNNTKEQEIDEFLKFCDRITDPLFIEICESFPEYELNKLQRDLDTDNYRNTIKVFTERAKLIASAKLKEIINSADLEIKRQEATIKNAQAIINDVHKTLEEAEKIYTL